MRVVGLEGLYMRFHLGQNEIFSIRSLVNFITVNMRYPEMKLTHCGFYFTAVILKEMKFHFG